MSSTLQSSVTIIQQNNYRALAMLTAIGYDYILTLPKEIEYIWNKPWTGVSALFILVRYCGLYNLVICAFCNILKIIERWTYILFLGAADFVMILRVWAMYNRSRLILGTLLALFSVEIISIVVAAAVYSDPRNVLGVVVQVLDYSFCSVEFTPPIWGEVTAVLQIIFSVALFVLAIVRFVKQSIHMYNATKQWRLDRYVNLLVKEGIVYFFAIFLLNSISLLTDWGVLTSDSWQSTLRAIVENVPAYTLAPRFIISIRELYTRDLRGRQVHGIDTGFGLSTLSGGGAIEEPILFADDTSSETAETVEADDVRGEESENSELTREVWYVQAMGKGIENSPYIVG